MPGKENLKNTSSFLNTASKLFAFLLCHSVVREHGDMTLSRFKFIWYMEWGHRQWGRLIGVAYAIPAALFWYRGCFNKSMKVRVVAYGALIGFQGLLGWYMVRSGLKTPPRPAGMDPKEEFVGVPRVSHYRLAAHLSTAAILYALFLWSGFSHLSKHPQIQRFPQLVKLKIWSHSSKALMFTTLIFGAFVAGLDAGLTYNSWPKMADRWVPEDFIVPRYGSTLRNLVDNPTAVQFMHRNLAYLTVLAVTATWAMTLRVPGGRAVTGQQLRNAAHLMLAATVGQSAIGVIALLEYVPVWLGALHQGGALALLSTIMWYTHCLRAVPK
uniref:Cytochrome c oxidase assembly protein COX15 n=1 Tax=Mesocestoides corti TaxID=53468 RepID=A0A5K3FJT4_MESCO